MKFKKKYIDNKTIDNKTIDNKTIDNKTIHNKTIDNKTIDNKTIDNKTIDNNIENNELKKIIKLYNFDGIINILDIYKLYKNNIVNDNLHYVILKNVGIINKTRFIIFNNKIYFDKIDTNTIKIANEKFLFQEYFSLTTIQNSKTHIKDKLFLNLSNPNSNNYCHFIIDLLSYLINFLDKLELLYNNLNKYIFTVLVSDKLTLNFLKELFDFDIILLTTQIIYTSELIIPKYIQNYNFCWNKENIKYNQDITNINYDYIKKTRKFIFKKFNIKPQCSKNIYLQRNNNFRKILNINDVEKIFTDNNYEFVKTDNMTLCQQASLFSQCKNLICQAGAGLTNLIFCPPNCNIYVIVSKNIFIDINYFSKIANAINFNIIYIYCTPKFLDKYCITNNNIKYILNYKTLLDHPFNSNMEFTEEELNNLENIIKKS